MSDLERVLYRSRATGTTDSLLNLAAILSESQRGNDRAKLTGVLAAHRDHYVQVLEGSGGDIDRLLRRLETDPRHRDIVIMDRRPVEARSFGGWAMASARITPEAGSALDRLIESDAAPAEAVVGLLRDALDVSRAPAARPGDQAA